MLTGSLIAGTVEWLSAAPTFRGIELRRFKVLDEGNDGFLDVHEFRPLDEDEYRGEGVLVGHFSRARELLDHAVGKGARLDRWVNKGVVQDEYAALRTQHG